MELTKKDFEQILTKKLNDQTKSFDAKLDKQTKELKAFAENQTEILARMVASQVVRDINDKLSMAVRMARMEEQMQEIRSALNLSPSR